MANDAERVFTCLLAIGVSALENCPLPIFIGLSLFLSLKYIFKCLYSPIYLFFPIAWDTRHVFPHATLFFATTALHNTF